MPSRSALAAYTGQYWNLPGVGASPAFPGGAANLTRSDADINFNWGQGSPDASINVNGFVARWTQTVDLAAGSYYFWANADDGVRVYLDGVLVINGWVDQSPTVYTAVRNITAGSHEIKVEYYENGGGAVVQFSYQNWSPVAQSYSPADGATGVGLNDNLVLTFDKNVAIGSSSADDIVIYDSNDQVVEQINSSDAGKVSISNNILTINPAVTFTQFKNYYVKIKSDIFYSTAYGYNYFGIGDKTTWNFQTADLTKPSTSDDYGANDGVWQNSNQTIALTPADPSGSGIVWTKYCTDDGTVACNPAAGTTLPAPYQVTINSEGTTYLRYASQDNSGNTQDTVSRVVRIDKTVPTVSAGNDQEGNTVFTQTASVSDPLSGVDASTYSWTKTSGPGTVTFGNSSSLSTSIDVDMAGTYVISFSVSDNASNSSSDSFTFTDTGNIGLPPQALAAPVSPVAGFGVKINDGAAVTSSRNVSLRFTAGSDIKKVAISQTDDFSDAALEDFEPLKSWDLCAGNEICSDGVHTVYVKFYNHWGKSSQPVSSSINLVSAATTNPGGAVIILTNPDQSGTNQTDVISLPRFIFTRYLRLGMTGEDVRQLQIFLNRNGFMVASSGPGSSGRETIYFGPATKQAVVRFQKKHNLKPYPGNVGPATLRILNSLS